MTEPTNITLYFSNVEWRGDSIKKNYTFITSDSKSIRYLIDDSFSQSSQNDSLHISNERRHTISVENTILYDLCKEIFSNINYIKHEGCLVFDAEINTPSFVKNLLINNNKFEASTFLELFFKKHDILKSYYNNTVKFLIKSVNSEFSKEFGDRDFTHYYEATRIDDYIIQGFIRRRHEGQVYSSKTRQYLVSMSGIDDHGNLIDKKTI